MFLWAGCPVAFGAVDFDGTDDYVSIPDAASLDLTIGTTSAWVKVNITGVWHGIVSKGTANSSTNSNYGMEISDSNIFICDLGNNVTYTQLGSVTTVVANQFYHIACTWDGTTLRLYLDGSENASVAQGLTPAVNTALLYIGQYAGDVDRLHGIIDDVRIYNRALSASEIEVIAKGRLKYDSLTTPGNGLVGYWPLDDSPDGTSGDGDTFVDRSGTGNNGTGVDGANNTGLTAKASGFLMYPARVQ